MINTLLEELKDWFINDLMNRLLFNITKLWNFAVPYIRLLIIAFIVFFLITLAIDYYKSKTNSFRYKGRKRRLKVPGSKDDLFERYWLWEQGKKKFYYNYYLQRGLSPYKQHAVNSHNKPIPLPFLREVYAARN